MAFTIATWVRSAFLLSTHAADFAGLPHLDAADAGDRWIWPQRRDSADIGGGHHRPSGKHPCQVPPVVRLRVHSLVGLVPSAAPPVAAAI